MSYTWPPAWTTERCIRCGWLFQRPRDQANRLRCLACMTIPPLPPMGCT